MVGEEGRGCTGQEVHLQLRPTILRQLSFSRLLWDGGSHWVLKSRERERERPGGETLPPPDCPGASASSGCSSSSSPAGTPSCPVVSGLTPDPQTGRRPCSAGQPGTETSPVPGPPAGLQISPPQPGQQTGGCQDDRYHKECSNNQTLCQQLPQQRSEIYTYRPT